MQHTLTFFDNKTLCLYSNLNFNINLLLSIKTAIGVYIYNIQLSNVIFISSHLNKIFSRNRVLHVSLLNINKSILNLTQGYVLELILIGLGFKIIRSKKMHRLYFELHFSHNLIYKIPSDILVKCGKKKLLIFGLNKQRVVDTANEIKRLRIPNIYKGKGIRFITETVKLKPGKQR